MNYFVRGGEEKIYHKFNKSIKVISDQIKINKKTIFVDLNQYENNA